MFVKNFYVLLAGKMLSKSSNNVSGFRVSSGAYRNVNTGYTDVHIRGFLERISTSMGVGGVVFGDGDTPPTVDDYTLSGNLITTITGTASVTLTNVDNGVEIYGNYTLTNTSSEAITIREIGLLMEANVNAQSTGTVSGLTERSLLESPITIPAGGIGQVYYTIRFDYPTE